MRRMYQRPSSAWTSLASGVRSARTRRRVAEQGLVLEPAQDVRDGPAQVAWDQAEKPGAGRREPLDLELLVQEHRGDGRAFEQVEQVVVDALELLDLVLKAGIDGVELLVQGLELLLGGLELLVGGLELLIGRRDFLVGGLELVVRALELGDRALKLLAGDLQFVLELLKLVLPFGGPAGLRRRRERSPRKRSGAGRRSRGGTSGG